MNQIGRQHDKSQELKELALPVLEGAGRKRMQKIGTRYRFETLTVQTGLIHVVPILKDELCDPAEKKQKQENQAQKAIMDLAPGRTRKGAPLRHRQRIPPAAPIQT